MTRFDRAIDAVSRIDHPNVMELLDFGTEPLWYISELGKDLGKYWREFANVGSRADIERHALAIVRDLARGLAECHKHDLIHRDLKPKNVVIYEGEGGTIRPVLIDFGIVFVEGGERLTDLNEATGNRRYSPDQVRYRVHEPRCWFDIFALVQILMWMVWYEPGKQGWDRPMHWRYVPYPENTSPKFVEPLLALGAVASNEPISPQNGSELLGLLETLFEARNEVSVSDKNVIEMTAVREAISSGTATKLTRKAIDREELDASRELARIVFTQLKNKLVGLKNQLADLRGGFQISISINREFGELCEDNDLNNSERELLEFECQVTNGGSFVVQMNIQAFVPSRWKDSEKPTWLKDANTYACSFCRKTESRPGLKFPFDEMHVCIDREGRFVRHDRSWKPVGQITPEEIRNIVRSWLLDAEAWKLIAET